MECQQFRVWPIHQSMGCIVTIIQWGSICHHYSSQSKQKTPRPIQEMNINGESMNIGIGFWTITAPCNHIDPWSQYRPPLWAKMLAMISLLPSEKVHPCCINVFGSCNFDNVFAMQRYHPIIEVLAALVCNNTSDDIASTSKNESERGVNDC
jgi:hypothetical protein